jgi:predicted XRE-type DNA-binding protein
MDEDALPRKGPLRIEGALLQEMARLVTKTTLSYREIGERLGVSASRVQSRVRREGWSRPSQDNCATLAAATDPDRRRRGFTERMWRIAEHHLGQLEQEQQERPQGLATREMIGLVQAVDKLTTLTERENSGGSRKSAATAKDIGDRDFANIQPLDGVPPEQFTFRGPDEPPRNLSELSQDLDIHLQHILAQRGTFLPQAEAETGSATITSLRNLAMIADVWEQKRAKSDN